MLIRGRGWGIEKCRYKLVFGKEIWVVIIVW